MPQHHDASALGRVARDHLQLARGLHPVGLGDRETVAHRAPIAVLFDLATGGIHHCADPGQVLLEGVQRLELLGARRGDFAEVTQAFTQAIRRTPPVIHLG